MNIRTLERLLQEKAGLWSEAVGRRSVVDAISRRMNALGLGTVAAYEERVLRDPAELQALIEQIVVPETWFFRDERPFTLAVELAVARRRAGRALRFLSLPCSTGAEPYSLAIALLNAGFTRSQFHIDAIDISAVAIETARRGVYGPGAFRGQDLAWRAAWFKKQEDGWHIDPRLKAAVTFAGGNLFALPTLDAAPLAGYDFIFCRNLLIYFDAATQMTALRSALGRLTEDGVVFVGHAEAAVALRAGLHPWPAERVFAFTRTKTPAPGVARVASPAAQPAPKHPAGGMRSAPATTVAPIATVAPPAPAPTAAPAGGPHDLAHAGRLADSGQLEAAEQLVHGFLEQHGPSAPAFYLLGLAADAKNDSAAAEAFYRKALYLEPAHLGALAHLAPSLEQRGRRTEARRLRERMQRLSPAGGAR